MDDELSIAEETDAAELDEPRADIVEFKQAKTAVRNEQLRRNAGIAYITDPQCDSIDKLANHPKFEGRVSRRALEHSRQLGHRAPALPVRDLQGDAPARG